MTPPSHHARSFSQGRRPAARRLLAAVVAGLLVVFGMTSPAFAAPRGLAHRAVAGGAPAATRGLPSAAGSSSGFVPVTPSRVLDTRTVTEPAAKSTTTITVAGHGGIPSSGVAAVVVNVTAVSPAEPGFVTAWPAGATRPTASNLNYVKSQIVANQAIVKLGTSGRISLYTLAKANLLVDVTGYYPTGVGYTPLAPARVLDTRTGKEPGAKSTTKLVVTGHGGVPTSGVGAVVVNVTAVTPTAPGFVTAWPAGVAMPTASMLNYPTGGVVAGMGIVKVGTGGAIDLYTLAKANLVVDVAGWIPASGSDYHPITPTRVLDTRSGLGGAKKPVAAKGTIGVQATGVAGVPTNATAIEATITAVAPSGPGFVTAWPAGVTMPTASTLNYAKGLIVANSATIKLGTGGKLDLYTLAASNLLVDITGYWTPTTPPSWHTPMLIDQPQGPFNSVSCASSTFCAAVDWYGNAVVFNGTTWSVPKTIDPNAGVTSLSCPTRSFCAAVDRDGNVLTFNGSSWSAPTNIDTGGNALWAVSCPSTSFCAATDEAGKAITFNGSTWSGPKTVDPDGRGLMSVSCPIRSFCAAVDGSGSAVTFNGSTWGSPNVIDSGVQLNSVSCPTTSFCVAGGYYGDIVKFNPSTWASTTIQSSQPSAALSGVSCPLTSFCAGTDWSGNAGEFNGATWTPFGQVDATAGLSSVSCASASFCAAVDQGAMPRSVI